MTKLNPGSLYKKYVEERSKYNETLQSTDSQPIKQSSGFMSRQGMSQNNSGSNQQDVDPRLAAFNYINGYRNQLLNNRQQPKAVEDNEGNM